jgi:hypothetical protein
MVNYVSLAAKAKALIEANGRDLTFKTVSRAAADANKPWRGPSAAPTEFTLKGVVVDYDEDDVDGDLVRRGDKRVLVAQNSITGGQDMKIVDAMDDGGLDYKVVAVSPVAPGDTTIIYEIQARR